eukprot:NODE_1190_length_645_cov_265.243295_g1181_i0.p2 GENE.NODE_1190_length_645_cov_265.243295_g1181_i0~~NODE_1190_length_645_cov_265.243295_g1181_i0.p2  ORF type:complete len:113 (+),score=9.62 NODE_1190_length_645_cov_265.243295_g1181_i0:126-464(+)
MFPRIPFNLTWLDWHCNRRFGIPSRPHWMEFLVGVDNFARTGATRIIFSNGMQDPWHVGGVLRSLSPTLVAVIMENGAHHVDLRGSDPADTPDVIEARHREQATITEWLKEL